MDGSKRILEPYLLKNPSFLQSDPPEGNQKLPQVESGSKPKDDCDDFDYCLVVDALGDNYTISTLVNLLEEHGKNTFQILKDHNLDATIMFILIRATLEKLRDYAQEIKYQMLCDPDSLSDIMKNHGRLPNEINGDTSFCPFSPYECIYVPYTKELESKKLFWCAPGMDHPFRSSIRLKLLAMIIDRELMSIDENFLNKLRVRKHIIERNMLAFFPLHSPHIQYHLSKQWLGDYTDRIWPWKVPLFQIKGRN